ncbi:MAG: hypothetical protein M3O46_08905, partial [Myxococcota bacterium]|nr:hypothetical protein [Myxococcota bacterium]
MIASAGFVHANGIGDLFQHASRHRGGRCERDLDDLCHAAGEARAQRKFQMDGGALLAADVVVGERVEPERQGGAQECAELDGHVV